MRERGRPKVDKPKDVTLSFRVTQEEYNRIQAYATLHNLTTTQTLMNGVKLLLQKDQGEGAGVHS